MHAITIDVDTGRTLAHVRCEDEEPPFKKPRLVSGNILLYGFYAYRTLSEGNPVDGRIDDFPSCGSRHWQGLPAGWQLAPDTEDVRKNVVAPFTWRTHAVILHNETGSSSFYPAFRTAGFPPAGEEFGDSQPKLQTRVLATGNVEYRCPWICYQVLIRRRIRGREENDTMQLDNFWTFSDV